VRRQRTRTLYHYCPTYEFLASLIGFSIFVVLFDVASGYEVYVGIV